MTEIVFLFYDAMTALDAVGPYEVLARLPGTEVRFAASTPGRKTADAGLVLNLLFDGALVALLLHPMSRDYQRIWFD